MLQSSLLMYPKYMMVLSGTWRLPHFKNPFIQKLYPIYALVLQSFCATVCLLMFVEFFYLLRAKDVKQLTDNVRITVVCTLATLKTFTYQNKPFPQLMKKILENERELLRTADEPSIEIHQKFVKYVNRCSIAIMVVAGVTSSFLVVVTTLLAIAGTHGKPMIFLAHFPFDQNEYYGVALLLQGITVGIAYIFYCMAQTIYISILVFVKTQLMILQDQFRNFDEYKMEMDDFEMIRLLIGRHQFLIGFVSELNGALKFVILIEFLLSSLNIAAGAFQLMAGQTITDLSFSIFYLIAMIGQLFIMAWHANDISVESLNVSAAVYESFWYRRNILEQRLMQMVMIRAQKPLVLTIGPFNPLTTQTVIAVINAAYSYVTLMTSNY